MDFWTSYSGSWRSTPAVPGPELYDRSIARLGIAAGGVLAACVSVYLAVAHPGTGLVVAVAVIALLIPWAAPARYSLGLALALVLLFPAHVLPLPTPLDRVPYAAYPLCVWLVRRVHVDGIGKSSGALRILAAAVGAYLFLSYALAPIHIPTGFLWALAATACIVASSVLQVRMPEYEDAVRWFVFICGGLALLAMIEAFVVKGNPIYGPLYVRAASPVLQSWSEYRATTSLGHPLVNGTVFSVAATLAVSQAFRGRSRFDLLTVIALLGGVAATRSRGAVLAFAVGVALLVMFQWEARQVRAKITTLGTVALLVAALAGAVIARADSSEGQASVDVRRNLGVQTFDVLKRVPVTGAGPNQADALRTRMGLLDSDSPLESSAANALADLGIPGFILLSALLGGTVILGLSRSKSVPAAAALSVLLVSIISYRGWMTAVNLLALAGFLVACVHARRIEVGVTRTDG